MNTVSTFLSRAWCVSVLLAAAMCSYSCITKNHTIGDNYVPTDQKYDIYNAEIGINDIRMEMADSLSGYSTYRFTFGSTRDPRYGLTSKLASFTLVPVEDTLDFGKPGTQVFRQFHLSAVNDSVSVCDPLHANILQNVHVYALDAPLDYSVAEPKLRYTKKRITKGVPVVNGVDSLSFDFTEEFGKQYLDIKPSDLDTITNYVKRFPGIVIETDAPRGEGGRINMFKLPINVNDNTINGSYAELKFTAEYTGKGKVDTTFLFYLGPVDLYDLSSVSSTTVAEHPQVAYDLSIHSTKDVVGPADKEIFVEGGRGLKPVVKAAALRNKMVEVVSQHADPKDVIITRATLVLPFEFPEDYTTMWEFPTILSPTSRIVTSTNTVLYAGLSDASVDTENQGDINRSLLQYAPDISHHAQEILHLKDLSQIENYDIWMLPLRNEVLTETNADESTSSMAALYQQLAYQSYYNNMYGGYGYGSYSSYSSYSNYYSYMMMAQMYAAAASGTSSSTQTMVDMHRFYRGTLNGPNSSGRKPTLKITYVVPKDVL